MLEREIFFLYWGQDNFILHTLEFDSDGRAGDVRFRSIPTPTPPGRSYVGGMVVKWASKDCIFHEDFGNAFKSAVGAVVYELR